MPETSEKFVLVADDHPLCKEIVQICLERMDGNFRLFGVSSFAELSGALDQLSRCDLLVLDLSLGDSTGIDTLKRVRNGWPSVPILVLSGTENLQVQHLVREMGVIGYIGKSKPIEMIERGLSAALAGQGAFDSLIDGADSAQLRDRLARVEKLTPAQLRVLNAMALGELNKQIAHELGITEITVKAHVKAILSKLGVSNRTQAILEVKELKRLGLIGQALRG
ncbi:response regulator transcription factor [Altererythrobacter litoralis]